MRYLPLTDKDRREMLDFIGVDSVDEFFRDVPVEANLERKITHIADHLGEIEVERHLSRLARKNQSAGERPFFVGCGAYRHHIPASVDQIIQRSEFLTTYTPYQPEIAQGTLQTLFEFQSQVAALMAMDVANSSMYDGSTACAEAALMAVRVTKRNKVILSGGLHPHYMAATRLLCEAQGIEVIELEVCVESEDKLVGCADEKTACVVAQSPNFFGTVTDLSELSSSVHKVGALLVSGFTETVSMGMVMPPGEMGADIAFAEGQSIGNSLNFGGPYVGLFAAKNKFLRQMPGRLCGETTDLDGNRGFVLTLSTREQHIRRGKATSNICTNAGLCALAFSAHMTLLGEKGLTHLARINHEKACELADALSRLDGVEVLTPRFFNEFAFRTPENAEKLIGQLMEIGILGGVPASRLIPRAEFKNVIISAVTECTTSADIKAFVSRVERILE